MTRPELGREALYGLPGEVVEAIDPYTEADPVAVLLTFLTAVGNYMGSSPRIFGGGFQPGRLNVLLVGKSARARKGTSWYEVRSLFERVDEEWARDRVAGGLASGEAVISSVMHDDKDGADSD
jgi:hypothetical protein